MASKNVFSVDMTCGGCANAVTKVLEKNKSKGIEHFEIDLEKKTVTVTGTVSADETKTILEKTGKKVEIFNE